MRPCGLPALAWGVLVTSRLTFDDVFLIVGWLLESLGNLSIISHPIWRSLGERPAGRGMSTLFHWARRAAGVVCAAATQTNAAARMVGRPVMRSMISRGGQSVRKRTILGAM
jgi:hypothetical protein